MDSSNSRNIQLQIAVLLMLGIMISVTIVIIGAVYYLMTAGHESIYQQAFYLQKPQHLSLDELWREALSLSPLGIIQFGVFTLVITQLFRVILCTWYFAKTRDKIFVAISLFVLCVVCYSLFWSF